MRLVGKRGGNRSGLSQKRIRPERDEFSGGSADALDVAAAPPKLDPQIAARLPARLSKRAAELADQRPRGLIAFKAHQHADEPRSGRLLRIGSGRSGDRSSGKKSDELAPFHCRPPNAQGISGLS